MDKLVITIGRQFGSGGRAVARELGRKLGIEVYDHELLSKAAEESGFSRDIFKKRDEKHRKFSFAGFFGSENNFSESGEVFRMQSETIRRIAERGSAIIVGRCSDYILRDLDYTLDVFLTAPLEARIERVCARMNVSREVALEIIAKKDKNRPAYYNYFTFGNWGVAATYDLCIDTSILGDEGTADYIIEFARKAGKLPENL